MKTTTIQDIIKQLDILLSRERYLLGCSSDEHQRSQMIEALEIAKEAVEKSERGNYCPNCGAKMDKE